MKYIKTLLGLPFALAFMAIFALLCGVATFIENDFTADAARALVYNALYFEILLGILCIQLVYNLVRFKMHRKMGVFILHLSFVFMAIGALSTRYLGEDASMHIRENSTNNVAITYNKYIRLSTLNKHEKTYLQKKVFFNALTPTSLNEIVNINGKKARLKVDKYIYNPIFSYQPTNQPNVLIQLLVSSNGHSQNLYLQKNQGKMIGGVYFAFEKIHDLKNAVNFSLKDDQIILTSTLPIDTFTMATGEKTTLEINNELNFTKGRLYTANKVKFSPKTISLNAKPFIKNGSGKFKKALILGTLGFEGTTRAFDILLNNNEVGQVSNFYIGQTAFSIYWGNKLIYLPFEIYLKDFHLGRYPGSRNPSTYSSYVEVRDNEKFDYHIHMNNILDYKGYRFFQSSYDPDEKGTVLSVNYDPGAGLTYIGYFLMMLGFVWIFFTKNGRFRKLAKTHYTLMLLLFLLPTDAFSANKSLVEDTQVQEAFGSILVQGSGGRLKPLDTLAKEILNKTYHSNHFKGQDAIEVLMRMLLTPKQWQQKPMIKISNKQLKKELGLTSNYATYNNALETKEGLFRYKLTRIIDEINRKRPAWRTEYDKALLKFDEKINILFLVYSGSLLKIFPEIGKTNAPWINPSEILFNERNVTQAQGYFVGLSISKLFSGLKENNKTQVLNSIKQIKNYQRDFGKAVVPSKKMVNLELLLNKLNILERLYPCYTLAGLLLLFTVFAQILNPKLNTKIFSRTILIIASFLFLAHTAALGMRWVISGHAPWSNSYESMVYIAWAIVLAGLLFAKNSVLSLCVTLIMAGITLFGAHLSWMDPQITNLVPVLKSYWLTIHVNVITASYGFFGLCFLLSVLTLVFYAVLGKNSIRNARLKISIKESVRISEMSMMLGLAMLSTGNFLGGIWANESWGRYWGWDPKETWTLISILIYACIVHFKYVPFLNNRYIFSTAAMIAFGSILMTYFGVNFYLSGMHSYAAGDPVPIPAFVYYGLGLMAILVATSARNRKLV